MKICILCSLPTTGSIGAAGIPISVICQKCRNSEDQKLVRILTRQIDSAARLVEVNR